MRLPRLPILLGSFEKLIVQFECCSGSAAQWIFAMWMACAQKNLKALCSSQHFKSYRDLLAQCRVLCNLVCLGDFVGESAFAEDDDQQEEPMPGDDGAAEAALPTTLVGRGSTLTGRHGPRARSNGPTQFFFRTGFDYQMPARLGSRSSSKAICPVPLCEQAPRPQVLQKVRGKGASWKVSLKVLWGRSARQGFIGCLP